MPDDLILGQPMHRSSKLSGPKAVPADRWADFKSDPTELDGIITDVNVTGSDPTLQVRGPDGLNWTIELADHQRNTDIGLTRSALLPGDPVCLTGRRTQRFGERRIKAMSLTVEGRHFDLFPDLALA